MTTVEKELELDGTQQDLDLPPFIEIQIENASSSGLGISVNDCVERNYESGSMYKSGVIGDGKRLYEDNIKVRGAIGDTIYYSYVIP